MAAHGPNEVLERFLSDQSISYSSSPLRAEVEREQEEQSKLLVDEERLQAVRDGLQQSQEITDRITSIIEQFEGRLMQLEETLLPIQTLTMNYKRAHENIDRTIDSVKAVLTQFGVSDDVDKRIQQGILGDYDSYMDSMGRVTEAIHFFSAHRTYRSAERALTELKALSAKAVADCEAELDRLLRKQSKASITVDTILHADAAAASAAGEGGTAPTATTATTATVDWRALPDAIQTVDEADVQVLAKLATRLHNSGAHGYARAYCKVRSRVLLGVLQSADMASSEGWRDKRYQGGTHPFLLLLQLFLKLCRSERSMAQQIVHVSLFDTALHDIFNDAFLLLMSAGESLLKPARDNTEAIFVLLDVFDTVKLCSADLYEVLRCNNEHHELLMFEFVQTLTNTTRAVLTEFAAYVENHSDKIVPRNGTVHQHTSTVLNCMSRLSEYEDIVVPLLPPQEGVTDANPFTALMVSYLHALSTNLQQKSAAFKSTALSYLFLLNNHNHMVKHLSMMEDGGAGITEGLAARYQKLLEAEKGDYVKCTWEKALQHVENVDTLPIPAGGDVHKSLKNMLKSRYAGFNSAFEEVLHLQRAFVVVDVDLRAQLRRSTSQFIVPRYTALYNRTAALPFASNTSKYIRYTPKTLEDMIQRFFEPAE